MRHIVKRALERSLVLSGAATLGRFANRGRALVLMYHNVVPARAAAGDRSLHLPRDAFARQLDHLRAVCDLVPLETLIDRPNDATGRTRVAITFDDAYVGALSLGVPELVRRRIPATIFVPPGLLGEEMWWDRLSAASQDGMNPRDRMDMLRAFQGRADLIRASRYWVDPQNPSPLDRELRIADAVEVARAAAQPGISIGSHTWSHPNLSALEADLLHAELTRSQVWLREHCPSFVPYVTYPYGLSSPAVEQAAARAGYTAGLLAAGGWLPREPQPHRFALPRFDVSSGLSLDGFRLRLAGIGLA